MQINEFGNVDILSWGLVPNHDAVTDGSFVIFKAKADEDTEFYAAVDNPRAWLRLRSDFGWDTYYGTTEENERIALVNQYFGAC